MVNAERETLDEMMPLVYEQLLAVAKHQLGLHGSGGALSAAALVHETYLKLADQSRTVWSDRAHFFALASLAMRHVLADFAKARLACKRGGVAQHIALDDEVMAIADQPDAVRDVDEALSRLAAVEPRLARVVACRFYGGLSESETAVALCVTTRTVQRDWVKARMLLRRALSA